MTTAQQLGSLVKSARDIMRKDKGLNGDLDRLPMLTWVMFLKFLDDMEQLRETEAGLRGEKFKPAIESPYRWRDWAAREDGITGDKLIRFVNQEEATRPDGKKGAGLFAYLKGLQGSNGGDRRDVIATVFKGTVNPANCIAWWTKRKETDRAWKIPAKQIIDNGCNLDIKNPAAALCLTNCRRARRSGFRLRARSNDEAYWYENTARRSDAARDRKPRVWSRAIRQTERKEDLEHLPPEKLVESIVEKEKRILEIMGEIKALLAEGPKA